MDNPARTANYLAERDARLCALQAGLGNLLRGRDRIVLEIGCGHGHFLTAYAAAHPRAFCVGFDIVLDRIERAGRKRKRAALDGNLAFVRAEAVEFFSVLPPHVRFTDIFILFPDPWPKRRHHKNRILRPEILSTLAERSISNPASGGAAGRIPAADKTGSAHKAGAVSATPPGGATRLYFRTDYAPYFADARQTIAEHPDWKIAPAATPWPFEYETVFQSRADAYQSLVAFRLTQPAE